MCNETMVRGILAGFPEVLDLVLEAFSVEENAKTIVYGLNVLEIVFNLDEPDSDRSYKALFLEKGGARKLDELGNHRDEECTKNLNRFLETFFPEPN